MHMHRDQAIQYWTIYCLNIYVHVKISYSILFLQYCSSKNYPNITVIG